MFVFWWTATLSSRLLTQSFVYNRLEAQARSVVSIIEFPDRSKGSSATPTQAQSMQSSVSNPDSGGNSPASSLSTGPRLGAYKLDPAYELPASGHYFVVRAGDKLLSSRSAWDQFFNVPQLAPAQQIRKRGVGGGRGTLYCFGMVVLLAMAMNLQSPWPRDVSPIEERFTRLSMVLRHHRAYLTGGPACCSTNRRAAFGGKARCHTTRYAAPGTWPGCVAVRRCSQRNYAVGQRIQPPA